VDKNTLNETVELSLAGKITFPEIVRRLIANHVERYIADLVGLKITYFNNSNEFHEASFKFNAFNIAQEFNATNVKNAIIDSQQGRIDYQTFLKRIMSAGCTHYEVFITGKRVIYFGRDGNHHIELFPSAKK